MPYVERDVSVDQAAAQEMIRRTGQGGVPVITAGNEVIIGFDRPKLEQVAHRYAEAGGPGRGLKLGLLVRNTPNGVEIGGARPGSPAERSGARAGDLLESVNGQPIRSVSDLERVTQSAAPGRPITLDVQRDGRSVRLPMSAA